MLLKSPTGAPRGKKILPSGSIYRIFGDKKKLLFFFFFQNVGIDFFLFFCMQKCPIRKKNPKKRKVNKVDKKTRTKKVSYALACCDRKRLANVPLGMYRNQSATDSGSNGSPRRYQKE